MSISSFDTTDRLRQVIAQTLSINAEELERALGQLVVASSPECPSAGPEDRSLHDVASRTTVLLSDRIPVGQEAMAMAEEIARWHGAAVARAVIGDRADELLGEARRADGASRMATLGVLQDKQIGVSSLVLAAHSMNPQIKLAIGTFEGTSAGGLVQIRLLHVLRAWGNDGRNRPDEHMVQAIHAGVGNYSNFSVGNVQKIMPEDVKNLVQLSASQLFERLYAQGSLDVVAKSGAELKGECVWELYGKAQRADGGRYDVFYRRDDTSPSGFVYNVAHEGKTISVEAGGYLNLAPLLKIKGAVLLPPALSVVAPGLGDGPVGWHGSDRWTMDRGAMPGEPFAYLDGDSDSAVAAMVEVQTPGRPACFEVRRTNGVLLSKADFPGEAAAVAERQWDAEKDRDVKARVNDDSGPAF